MNTFITIMAILMVTIMAVLMASIVGFWLYIAIRDYFNFIRHYGGRFERYSSYGIITTEILAIITIAVIWYIIIS